MKSVMAMRQWQCYDRMRMTCLKTNRPDAAVSACMPSVSFLVMLMRRLCMAESILPAGKSRIASMRLVLAVAMALASSNISCDASNVSASEPDAAVMITQLINSMAKDGDSVRGEGEFLWQCCAGGDRQDD